MPELHPQTSIVMPVYNAGEILRKAIGSIRSQTSPDWELICVDDGSTDGVTPQLLDEIAAEDSRIRVVHQRNSGPDLARKAGVSLARGTHLAFCDQDDMMHPQLVEVCSEVAKAHDVDFLAFRYRSWRNADEVAFENVDVDSVKSNVFVGNRESRARSTDIYCNAIRYIHIVPWSWYVKKSTYLSTQMIAGFGLSNLASILKASTRWTVLYIPLYYYNAGNGASMMHKPFYEKNFIVQRQDVCRVLELYRPERTGGDEFGEWEAFCRGYVIPQLKMFYNHVRRTRRLMTSEEKNAALRAFVQTLRIVFFESGVPFRWVKPKQWLPYVRLLLWDRFAHERGER